MADTGDTTVETSGVESPGESSTTIELTPEQRDEQTIARLLGTQPEEQETPATAEESTSDEQEPEDGEDEESDESAGEAAEGEGETPADDDDLPEVSDEDIENILDALEDRLLANPRIAKQLEERAKAESDRRFEERQRAESVSQASERLIREGRSAVEGVYGLYDRFADALVKAKDGDDVDVAFNRDELTAYLGQFGAAAVAETRRGYDNGFADAFREGVKLGGNMTEADEAEVAKIVQTASRIANDPKQGRELATGKLFVDSVSFLVKRAKEAGKAEALAEVAKRRDALKKVVGENGTKAAVAKIASTRKKLPAKPSSTPAQPTVAPVTMEAYQAAKRSGDYAEADRIMNAMNGR